MGLTLSSSAFVPGFTFNKYHTCSNAARQHQPINLIPTLTTNEHLVISEKFDSVINYYPGNKLKYIHYKTVQNFIFHLDNFSDNFQIDKISKLLMEYIDLKDQSAIDGNTHNNTHIMISQLNN